MMFAWLLGGRAKAGHETYAEVVEAIVEFGVVLFGIRMLGVGLASRYNRTGSELSRILISRDL